MPLPTIEEVAQQIKTGSPRETAAPEINVNAAAPTNPEESASHESPEVKVKDTPAPEKKDPMAAKFAALARREKEARARAEQAERAAQENATLRAQIEERAKQIEEREAAIRAAKRPSEILKAHGISYADVTQDVLGSYEAPEPDPVDTKLVEKLTPIESENKALREKLTVLESSLAEIQTERAQFHQQQIRAEIARIAKDSGHELILEVGDEAYTLVQLVQQDYRQRYKQDLSFKDACDKVEAYYDSAVTRLANTPKIKSRLAPTSAVPPKQTSPKKEVAERPTTLTNSLSQGSRAKQVDIDKLPKHEALAVLATQLRYKD